MPGIGVTGHRLVEQNVVAIGLEGGVMARRYGQQHGDQPEPYGQQHEEWAGQGFQPGAAGGATDLLTVSPECRDQHQGRQDADPLGDDP